MPGEDAGVQRIRRDRLAEVVVGAGGKAGLAVFLEGIGGHGHES
jgi:hypothetical protein